METPIISLGKNGLRATLFVAIDPATALMLALAIFIGMSAALGLYSKLFK
jgi:hypothetical protein